uniref:Uncharacterized protein n=1 Tax=Arundo donax TaxID=35708 RepID=A0A0A9GNZ4_ARUDO
MFAERVLIAWKMNEMNIYDLFTQTALGFERINYSKLERDYRTIFLFVGTIRLSSRGKFSYHVTRDKRYMRHPATSNM